MYEQEEKDGLCNTVRDEVDKLGLPATSENCWTYFVNKCRSNMHVVLAMSPAGDTLRIRCRSFPGMVSNTVIDWYFPWPPEALESVASYFLQEEKLPDEHRKSIIQHMVVVHQSMMEQRERFLIELRRHMYVTPKNFLDFISNYRSGMKIAYRMKYDTMLATIPLQTASNAHAGSNITNGSLLNVFSMDGTKGVGLGRLLPPFS